MNIKVIFNRTRPDFTERNVKDNDVAAISLFPLEDAQYEG
jgi:hypothetical protein